MFDFIDYIPKGRGNAISTENLVALGSFKDTRNLQKAIEAARNHGFVIASKSNDGGGYYIPQTHYELKAFIQTIENRANHSLRSLESAKAMLAGMEPKE